MAAPPAAMRPKPQAGVGAVCVWLGPRVTLSHCQDPKVWGQVGARRDGTVVRAELGPTGWAGTGELFPW